MNAPARPYINEIKSISLDGHCYRVHRYNILTTIHVIYAVYEPGANWYTHSTLHHDGSEYLGRLGTRTLPPDIDALPAMSDARIEAVREYHQMQYNLAYQVILTAYPHLSNYPHVCDMGEIETTGEIK